MPERKIIRGVRHGTTTYVPGMEDELAKVLSPEEVQRLSDKGYLEGGWGATAAKATTGEAKDSTREPAKEAPKPAATKEK